MKPLVLVVDDDEDDLWLMQKAMLQIGGTCQLNPFSDAASLLTYLDSAVTVPSLILIDYHLPRMDGLELTELLRSRPALKTVPFAWMSSEIDPTWEVRCRELDVSWCWVKPTDYTAWQQFVQQICGPLFASQSG
ncbi:response regulator [Larkinella sp. C7]|jgi:CheY-like chemotaxis protein|uniref:response regulator n=1 Tax=Larkinella sp. C7 TaxID=2576607 RepID=UPI00111152CD|nr:response regulator [Larkinella sp. C7]